MDNQQERLLWWLGGLIDGEGCFTITQRKPKGQLLLSPVSIITNTNKTIIDTCINIYREHNIPFYVAYKIADINRKEKWNICVDGLGRNAKLLTLITPFLVGKLEDAQLMKRFIDSRLERSKEYKGNRKDPKTGRLLGGNAPYNDEEFRIIERLAEIHNRNPQRLHAEIRSYKEKLRAKI
jgi:hypothetical protein